MRFITAARKTWGRGRLAVLALLVLCGQLLWAGEVELGLEGAAGPGKAPGVTASFSGASTTGVWMFGGYGSALWSPSFSLLGGGALVGLRPLPGTTVVAKAGLGAGFYGGESGATRQWGVEVSLGGPGMVFVASWERIWNLAELASFPSSGCEVWSLGVRLRFSIVPEELQASAADPLDTPG